MAIHDLNTFLSDYFETKNCSIEENSDGKMVIQLTEEMDRELMNRPFYWHYIKKLGRQGEPMKLSMITNLDRKDEQGEWIHFGSPRLHQILNKLKQGERLTKLFEVIHTTEKTPLYPWLITNIKVSYSGRYNKDEILSMGLQLVNGRMIVDAMDKLQKIPLEKSISDYCFTMSPIIKLQSGFKRIQDTIATYIENQDHDWAKDSFEVWKEEKKTLTHFYEDDLEHKRYKQELEDLKKRYQPTIQITVINGGIFYLNNTSIQ